MKSFLFIIIAAIIVQCGRAFIMNPSVIGRPSCNTRVARGGVEPLHAATKEKAMSTEVYVYP